MLQSISLLGSPHQVDAHRAYDSWILLPYGGDHMVGRRKMSVFREMRKTTPLSSNLVFI